MTMTKGEYDKFLRDIMDIHIPNIDKRLGHIASIRCVEDLYEAGIITKEAYVNNIMGLLKAGHMVTITKNEATESGQKFIK